MHDSTKKVIPVYMLTGFLGAGKTTLINRLIDLLPGAKLGILINDFGDLDVDACLLKEADGIMTAELNGGQIFCSCLSGSFVDSLCSFADKEIDYFFVECSGLAKPTPIMDILSEAFAKAPGAFEYKGMICVIDADTYEDLSSVLSAVDEQIEFSDVFLINKMDLVSEDQLARIEDKLSAMRPGAAILRTSYCEIDMGLLSLPRVSPSLTDEDLARYAGWGEQGRPVSFTLPAKWIHSREKLLSFLHQVAPDTYRIKGIVAVDSELLQIDCVGNRVHVHRYVGSKPALGIFLVSKIGAVLDRKISELLSSL